MKFKDALGFDKASKEMKLTRLIEKFDVVETVRVPSGFKK
jgi:hypothetical protein